MTAGKLAVAAALGVAWAGYAWAAPAPASITIAGGVSLGSYEAGLAYYAVEAMRANPDTIEPRLVTGASAGSVNALLVVLQACGERVANAKDSLFWQAWIPLGLERLAQHGSAHPTSAFSREALAEPVRLIEREWREGLRVGCDVVIGISVTRLVPRTVSTRGERLRLPRLEEHFVLRIQGRGPGKPPRLTNYADQAWAGDQVLLPEDERGEVPFGSLVETVFASTAFPGAFPPQAVAHCVVRGGQGGARCPIATAQTELFVDGGVFDNTPVGLALRVARAGLEVTPAGDGRWRDRPDLGRDAAPESLVVAYVSPEVATFPEPVEEPRPESLTSILGVTTQMGGAFLATARSKNLLYVADEAPHVFDRLVIPERHLPAASSPLGAFFGFIDAELRMFDFALGMYDAHRMVRARLGVRLERGGRKLAALPEDARRADREGPGWRRYGCLRAVLDRTGGAAEQCAGEELADFRRVFQTSVERLWDQCFRLTDVGGASDDDPLCHAARKGEAPLAVPGVGPVPGGAWLRRAGENETGLTVRLLAAHGFQFRDLGLAGGKGLRAQAAIRERLLTLGDAAANTQPGAEGLLVGTLVRLFADRVVYVPPRVTAWAVFGTEPELGVSRGFVDPGGGRGAIRIHVALQLYGLQRLLSSDPGGPAGTVVAGVEVLPAAFASTSFQPSLLLRGGWLFARGDAGGTRDCPAGQGALVGGCSQPTLQVGLAATALERIRLQLLASWYPAHRGGQRHWAVGPGLGAQWTW